MHDACSFCKMMLLLNDAAFAGSPWKISKINYVRLD